MINVGKKIEAEMKRAEKKKVIEMKRAKEITDNLIKRVREMSRTQMTLTIMRRAKVIIEFNIRIVVEMKGV